MNYIIILCALIMAFLVFLLFRNEAVYRYRKELMEEFFQKEDWVEKLKEFRSVPYQEMIYKFWKPLNSFYKTLGKKHEL